MPLVKSYKIEFLKEILRRLFHDQLNCSSKSIKINGLVPLFESFDPGDKLFRELIVHIYEIHQLILINLTLVLRTCQPLIEYFLEVFKLVFAETKFLFKILC